MEKSCATARSPTPLKDRQVVQSLNANTGIRQSRGANLLSLFPPSGRQLPARGRKLSTGLESISFKTYRGVTTLRRVKRGGCLFRAHDVFRCLYPIRSGFFKTVLGDRGGREQITGFFMPREVLGMEGFGSGYQQNSAYALEDSEVHVVPYSFIQELGCAMPSVQRHMLALVSSEIVRNQSIMLSLGSLDAKERLAAFLINLSERFRDRGYSGSEFLLRMTRAEIGSYLGLQLETVSRHFSAFQKAGLLDVHEKLVAIVDVKGLHRVLNARS